MDFWSYGELRVFNVDVLRLKNAASYDICPVHSHCFSSFRGWKRVTRSWESLVCFGFSAQELLRFPVYLQKRQASEEEVHPAVLGLWRRRRLWRCPRRAAELHPEKLLWNGIHLCKRALYQAIVQVNWDLSIGTGLTHTLGTIVTGPRFSGALISHDTLPLTLALILWFELSSLLALSIINLLTNCHHDMVQQAWLFMWNLRII